MSRVRDANFQLGTTVKAYEDCVAVQGTPKEDVTARVVHAKKREEARRACVALHDDLMAHMAEGSTDEKKSYFFTECYNFTSSVERFKKALDRSMKKERKRLEANRKELDKIKNSKLSEEERNDAISQCDEVEQITKDKERSCGKIKDDMTNLVSQLRVQASADVQANDDAADMDEEEGLLRDKNSKTVPYALIIILFFIAVILGSVRWYYWWTAGGTTSGR